jgi:hypothetical protein
MDYGEASLRTDLVPKITAYTVEKIRDLIKLDTLDKKRSVPIYRVRIKKRKECVELKNSSKLCLYCVILQTRAVGYMDNQPERWHPLITGVGSAAMQERQEVIDI